MINIIRYGNTNWKFGKPGEWVIPTISELVMIFMAFGLMYNTYNIMHKNIGFPNSTSWYVSSTELDDRYSYALKFGNGNLTKSQKQFSMLNCRPILKITSKQILGS